MQNDYIFASLMGAAGTILIVWMIWQQKKLRPQLFLDQLLNGWVAGYRWKKLSKRQQEKVKAELYEKIMEMGKPGSGTTFPLADDVLAIFKELNTLGIADCLSASQRACIAQQAIEKDYRNESACTLARQTWPNNVPRDLALSIFLERPDGGADALIPHVQDVDILQQAGWDYARKGDGDELLTLATAKPEAVSQAMFLECLGQAMGESDRVSCIIGMQNWSWAEDIVDTLQDKVQKGRLLVAMREAQSGTVPA